MRLIPTETRRKKVGYEFANSLKVFRSVLLFAGCAMLATPAIGGEPQAIWTGAGGALKTVTYADIRHWAATHFIDAPVSRSEDLILVPNPYQVEGPERLVAAYRMNDEGAPSETSTFTLQHFMTAGGRQRRANDLKTAGIMIGCFAGVFFLLAAVFLLPDYLRDLRRETPEFVLLRTERDELERKLRLSRAATDKARAPVDELKNKLARCERALSDQTTELRAFRAQRDWLQQRVNTASERDAEVSRLKRTIQERDSQLRMHSLDLIALRKEKELLQQRIDVIPVREAELEQLRRSLYAKQAQMLAQERHLNDLINRQKEQQGQVFMHLAQGGRL